jgi:hypothetical protein
MVEEEKHGETLNDDLVNKIMNELDETKIQTDPVFEQEDVKPIINDDANGANDAEEIANSKKKKKSSKKRKKPLIVEYSSDDEDFEPVKPIVKKKKSSNNVDNNGDNDGDIVPGPSFEDKFKNIVGVLKKTLLIAFVFFVFLSLKPKFTSFLSVKIPSINLVNDVGDLNTMGIFVFSFLFSVGIFVVSLYNNKS